MTSDQPDSGNALRSSGRLPPPPPRNAKSRNPGRLPPQVFLTGDDPTVPPVQAVMYWCQWEAMNPLFGSQIEYDDQWPDAVPRLGRTRIEIHEPARPFEMHAFICDDNDLATDGQLKYLHSHRHTVDCRYASFGDSKNELPRPRNWWNPLGCVCYGMMRLLQGREIDDRHPSWPETMRFDRDHMASDGDLTAIDLLPRRQLPIEAVELRANWQERLIPKSEEQVGVPDNEPYMEALDPKHPDALVWASYRLRFDNRSSHHLPITGTNAPDAPSLRISAVP